MKNLSELLLRIFGENTVTKYLVEQDEKRRRAVEKQEIALRAMKRAQVDPLTSEFRLTDIGLMAYRDRNTSRLIRNTPIVTDTKYLRPFVEISARSRKYVDVVITLLDSNGRPMFVDRGKYVVQARPTNIIADTWLPLKNVVHSGGSWSILVEVNNTPLAIHRFGWIGLSDNEIVQRLNNDGELTQELHQAVKTGKFRKMSLDELLADQED